MAREGPLYGQGITCPFLLLLSKTIIIIVVNIFDNDKGGGDHGAYRHNSND